MQGVFCGAFAKLKAFLDVHSLDLVLQFPSPKLTPQKENESKQVKISLFDATATLKGPVCCIDLLAKTWW